MPIFNRIYIKNMVRGRNDTVIYIASIKALYSENACNRGRGSFRTDAVKYIL